MNDHPPSCSSLPRALPGESFNRSESGMKLDLSTDQDPRRSDQGKTRRWKRVSSAPSCLRRRRVIQLVNVSDCAEFQGPPRRGVVSRLQAVPGRQSARRHPRTGRPGDRVVGRWPRGSGSRPGGIAAARAADGGLGGLEQLTDALAKIVRIAVLFHVQGRREAAAHVRTQALASSAGSMANTSSPPE